MRTLGVYMLVGLVAAMFYCQCGKATGWLPANFTQATGFKKGMLACNDEAVLEGLQEQLKEALGGIYEIERDFIVEWERFSAEHVVCRAKCVYKQPIQKPRRAKDDTAGLLEAVNEVFGLTRKKGDKLWVRYEVFRTLRDGETGGYVVVEYRGKGAALR